MVHRSHEFTMDNFGFASSRLNDNQDTLLRDFARTKPAARMGDPTAHGGQIAAGCPTVLIGG
jgi:hypothetical protein